MSVQGRSEILLSQCHPQPDGRAGRRRHRTDCRGPLLCGFVVRPSGSGGQRQEREDCVHPWCSSHRGGPERLGPCLSGYSGHRSTRGFSAFIIVHPPPPPPIYYHRYTRGLFLCILYCCFRHKEKPTLHPLGGGTVVSPGDIGCQDRTMSGRGSRDAGLRTPAPTVHLPDAQASVKRDGV